MPEEKFDCLVTSVTDLDSCAAVPLGTSLIGERTVEDNWWGTTLLVILFVSPL